MMMDQPYSEDFFSSFLENLQNLCQMYLRYNHLVEVTGYISVEIDNTRKERYALSEIVQATGNVLSESHCLKAFSTDISKHWPDFKGRQRHGSREKPYTVLTDHAVHRDDYENDDQQYVNLTRSIPEALKKRKVGTVYGPGLVSENQGEMNGAISAGQHQKRLQRQVGSNRNWNEVTVDHTMYKQRKKNGKSDSSPVDQDVGKERTDYCMSTSESVPRKQITSENDIEISFIGTSSSNGDRSTESNMSRSSVQDLGIEVRYPNSSSNSCQYQSAIGTTYLSTQKDPQSSESKTTRLRFGEGDQNSAGGSSEFCQQYIQEDLQHHADENVKKEVEEEVIYTGFKNSDNFFSEQEEMEQVSGADCETSSVWSQTWTAEHHATEDSPEADEIMISDDDDDTYALDGGSLDTSLLDATAQNKLATFKKPLQSALNTFIRFLHLKQVKEPVLCMSPETLDSILAEFYVCARTKMGQEFTSGSLRTIKNYLEFFLQHNGYPVSIARGKEFADSSHVLKQRLNVLRTHEKCSVAVRREDVDMLFSSGILGTETAESILRTLWLMITVHFQIKGAKKHLMMNWGDLELEVSNEGEEYLYYKPLGVIARGNRINPSRCFITFYKTYRELRPEATLTNSHPFYLDVANNHFQTSRICEHAMKCMWKRILVDANMPKEKKIIDMNIL